MKRYCTVCRFWTDHTASRHALRRPAVERHGTEPATGRALAWLWFWNAAGRPRSWRATSFDVRFGDRDAK
jgi:hypothetical protein